MRELPEIARQRVADVRELVKVSCPFIEGVGELVETLRQLTQTLC